MVAIPTVKALMNLDRPTFSGSAALGTTAGASGEGYAVSGGYPSYASFVLCFQTGNSWRA